MYQLNMLALPVYCPRVVRNHESSKTMETLTLGLKWMDHRFWRHLVLKQTCLYWFRVDGLLELATEMANMKLWRCVFTGKITSKFVCVWAWALQTAPFTWAPFFFNKQICIVAFIGIFECLFRWCFQNIFLFDPYEKILLKTTTSGLIHAQLIKAAFSTNNVLFHDVWMV